ncbi:MAG: LacI family DNA-binding transcriptional regulator [Lentisphaeria bacterium]
MDTMDTMDDNICSLAVHTVHIVHTVHSNLREQQLSMSDRLHPDEKLNQAPPCNVLEKVVSYRQDKRLPYLRSGAVMIVKLADIAREVGLDVSVVSRALNPGRVPHPVKKETRELILATAKRLGYRPNRQAAFLKKGSSATLMCFVPDVGHRLVADLVYGISEAATAADYPVSFFFGRTADDFCHFQQTLRKVPHAAAICYSPPHAQRAVEPRSVYPTLPTMEARCRKEILGYYRRRKTLLLLNLESNLDLAEEREIGAIPRIEIDEASGGRKVAEHFLECGCTRFFYGTGRQNHPLRQEGYFSVLRAQGIQVQPLTRSIIREMAQAGERSGIFVSTDLLALQLIGIMREERIPFGEKVLLSGYDDILPSAEISPSLTTIHQPTRKEGHLAVQLVQKCIAGEKIGIQRLEPLLKIRETSGEPIQGGDKLLGMEE